jgi:hypothetical protein
MTPQEEAKDLYNEMLYMYPDPIDKEIARYCAITAIKKVIDALKSHELQNRKEIAHYGDVYHYLVFHI